MEHENLNTEKPVNSDLGAVSVSWFDSNNTKKLPNGYYKVITNYEEEKEAEFFNGEWLDANNCMASDEVVEKYSR